MNEEAPLACRNCAHLKYRSQYTDPRRRIAEKARSLRCRLGIGDTVLDAIPDGVLTSNDDETRQLVAELVKIDPRFRDRDHWLVSADGNRFGFIRGPESATVSGDGAGYALVRFTYDWFDELRETIGETR